ncbi:MAG: hypothetical protein JW779_04150 [Candidatus Thorarchaeota archaeon]|nr:hypothetical protein [Candidatus Thorarchaeota archaeon]
MENRCISRTDILQSTLFHIQIKQCQYIDNFPEAVTEVIDSVVGKKSIKEYEQVKRRLYRIKTNFFKINEGKIKKKDFFEGLYQRIQNKT